MHWGRVADAGKGNLDTPKTKEAQIKSGMKAIKLVAPGTRGQPGSDPAGGPERKNPGF